MSTCIACQKEGKNVCSRCKACYCSVNCQKKHWPVHQKVCVKPDFAKPDKKPMANGVVSHKPGKINHDMGEEELLVEMDDFNIDGDVTFNIDEIRPQAELKRQSKVVIYAVENMLMKGQAVDVNETKKFLSLMQDLRQCVKENKRPLDAGGCKEGVLVLFDYQGEFTRGAVTKFDSRKLEATVLAIDFGNKEIVKLSDLYVMPQSALDVPRQCRTLVLHGFPSNLDPLTKDALSDRLKNITQDRILQFSVKGKVNGIYSGVLTVEDSNENVNDMMMSYYEEIKMSNKETTMRKRVMLQDIPMQPYPKGPEFNVIVTDVRSPSCFFAQIITEDKSNIAALEDLFSKLQELPDNSVSMEFSPVQNEACLAFFTEDQTWSRASVERIYPDGTVRVVFIDYGNVEDLDSCYVRPMTHEFSQLPRQAREFCLFGVKSSSSTGEWSDEAKKLFKDMVLSDSICNASCMSINDDTCVAELYLPNLKCYPHKILLEKGLAVAVTSCETLKENDAKFPFTLESNSIERTGQHRVIPLHFVSPHEFYVQIADREQIQQVYEFDALLQDLPVAPYSNPIVDDSCCALFSDDVWYRAKVVSVDGSECFVYFYDYGNTATVPLKNLRVMPEEMKSLKGQAIKVKLCDVLPIGESWRDEAKELMESKLSFQPCILNVLKIENELLIGSLTVETNDCNVAKMLVDAKLAKPLSKLKEDESSVVVKNQIEEKSLAYNKETGSVSKSQTKRKPFTLSIEQLLSHSNQRVIPVHFVSPDEFYVQIADREKIQQVYEFDALLQHLPVAPYSNPIVGDSCCALFSDDVWYRAKVVSIDGSECCVYFYDYGNTATVPIKNLRVMPEEMKSLKGQAIRVKLYDVLPTGESWRDEAKELMESKLSFQPCILNVLKIENELLIGSLTVETNDCDVAKMLIDAKLAKPLSKANDDESSVVVKNQIEEKFSAFNKETGSVSKSQTKRKPFTLSIEQLLSHSNQRVIPVHFVSPDEFYVQIADREKIQQVYEFDALLQHLPVAPYSNPIVGDSCCALFSDDVWYRAKVVSIDGSECCVYFYDYGNTATVPIKNLRVMPEEMKSLKGQAIRVKLYDVLPTGESWRDEAKELMESKLSFQPCILNVLKIESGVVVGSLLREEDGLDICIELFSAHLARNKFADSSNITKEVLGSGMVQVGALVPDVVGTNSLELEEEVPIKQTQVEDRFGSKTKTEENGKEFEEERPKIDAEPKPKTGKFKGKGAFGKANKPNDSERSSGDDGSDECNFYSRRSKEFVYQQNLKGRDRVFGRGVRGKFSQSHYPGHGHGSRSNHMLPPFPFFHPMMFSSLLMAPNSPSPMSPNSESESESLNFSESPKIDNKGQDWSFAEGKVTQFLQGDPHTVGRGQMLNQWADAWQRMSDFMNTAMATRSYKGFSDFDATHSYGSGNSFSKGRGGPRNMSRGTGRGAGRGQRPRLPQGQIPPSMLIGNKVDCVVTWVEHPSHFYIKPISDTGSAVLADDIYENAELAREANVGALVAAKSPSSGHFFRGIIEQCYARDSALIRDIDSGPTEVINTAGLRKMRVQDAEKPLQVIRCTLDNVVPKFSNLWSTAAIKYMKHKLSTANGKVKIIVRGQNSFAVRVNVCDPNNEERHIGKDLVKIGFAKFIY